MYLVKEFFSCRSEKEEDNSRQLRRHPKEAAKIGKIKLIYGG